MLWISSWLLDLIIKNSYLNRKQKSFFVKYIVLIFSLVRIAFPAIYKNVDRLLAWQIKFEERKALKKK